MPLPTEKELREVLAPVRSGAHRTRCAPHGLHQHESRRRRGHTVRDDRGPHHRAGSAHGRHTPRGAHRPYARPPGRTRHWPPRRSRSDQCVTGGRRGCHACGGGRGRAGWCASPAGPGVTTKASGRQRLTAARWILMVRPPRDRPGHGRPARRRGPPPAGPDGVLMSPDDRGVDRDAGYGRGVAFRRALEGTRPA